MQCFHDNRLSERTPLGENLPEQQEKIAAVVNGHYCRYSRFFGKDTVGLLQEQKIALSYFIHINRSREEMRLSDELRLTEEL